MQPTTHTGGVRFQSSFPPSAEALVGPRQAFGRWLAGEGLSDSLVSELSVVFSELTSNAASATKNDEAVRVRAWRDEGNVVLSVENPPPDDETSVRHWDLENALRAGGRGLLIVRAYTDSLEATTSDRGGVVVRCRRSLAG